MSGFLIWCGRGGFKCLAIETSTMRSGGFVQTRATPEVTFGRVIYSAGFSCENGLGRGRRVPRALAIRKVHITLAIVALKRAMFIV